MSRFRLTRDYCERLLEGYRQRPGSHTHAARLAGCHISTAKRAWRNGIKHSPWPEYQRPFQELIAEEQRAARAALADQKAREVELNAQAESARSQETRERVLEDLTEERVQETVLVRKARGATIVLLQNVGNVAAGVTALGVKVREALETRAAAPEALTLREASQVAGLIKQMATALRQANDAGQKAMEMTRLLVGEPTSIVGHKHLESVPTDEAAKRIEASARAMRRLQEKGIETVDGNAHADDPAFN